MARRAFDFDKISCIDWVETNKLGTTKENIVSNSPIVVNCTKCGAQNSLKEFRSLYRKHPTLEYLCKSCDVRTYASDPERIKKFKKSFAKVAQTEEYRRKCSENAKQFWRDPTNKDKIEHIKKCVSEDNKTNPIKIESLKKAGKAFTSNQSYKEHLNIIRSKAHSVLRERCKNNYELRATLGRNFRNGYVNYRNKFYPGEWRSDHYLQELFYDILDDLEIKYYREHRDGQHDPQVKLGSASVDCVIPRTDQLDLIVEINGNYWHDNPKQQQRDLEKANYLATNFPQYELKTIWEDAFRCYGRVLGLVRQWCGADIPKIDFDFNSVEITLVKGQDYRLLLQKYHYLHNAGRGGRVYGAFFHGKLIAVCVFSSPVRQNIAQSVGKTDLQTRELSRFCIHPCYQKENFASWFLSRCLSALKADHPEYDTVITYADKTFNHHGTIYKACNFEQDKIVRQDYTYQSLDGYAMGKKNLYQHAKSLGLTEAEYAEKYGYVKVYGLEKIRFVYRFKD